MDYLVTGGAGFIGSHLTDALAARGASVLVLDDLSTGRRENLTAALDTGLVELVEGSVTDPRLVEECVSEAKVCLHLASAVGVKLIVDRPLESLVRNVRGTDIVVSAAMLGQRPLLFTSSSEIYGKDSSGALAEDSDRILGPPSVSRWSYSTAKAFGESLAHAYSRETGADALIVRLFNCVGPRQTGAYGMVMPRLVNQALAGTDLTVYGDGTQLRCFTHVADAVRGIQLLLDSRRAFGGTYNLGSPFETSILELANTVIERTGSSSGIKLVPFEEAYGEGFEELPRRKPDTSAIRKAVGWEPTKKLAEMIDDVIAAERQPLGGTAAGEVTLATG